MIAALPVESSDDYPLRNTTFALGLEKGSVHYGRGRTTPTDRYCWVKCEIAAMKRPYMPIFEGDIDSNSVLTGFVGSG